MISQAVRQLRIRNVVPQRRMRTEVPKANFSSTLSSSPRHHHHHQQHDLKQRSFKLSTAAAEPDLPTPSKRKLHKKDPIIVTERAAGRIKELLSSPNGKDSIGIRLGVKRRGCNGLSYTLNYAFDKKAAEEEMSAHGVTIIIEPMALFNVVGTVMDFAETDMSSEFTFENPNSKGECGCGESFNV
eukprot:CAMPEP_0197240556 /NCGR_PEP_ID=MMETSP1429-20130617/6816_1 /TAXON_ID=49237 /ORGANISM="Chaetoceros  sp., Strain UNC1202" /LENGTH=184 /DNA_ID=CAMNT_0042700221 /DNA_START=15 /DNA_END=569 /DNA_ORIENTATION=+